jgi:iron-sulfur cluster assembly accessory protein
MLRLTDQATLKLNEVIAQQRAHGEVYALRLSVLPGGCSGHQYGMSLAEKSEAGDWEGEFGGVKVVVDPVSAPLLSGVEIDYVESLQGAGFTISNPHAVSGCGCGKSFETEETAREESAPGGCGCGSGACGCGGH